MRNLYPEIDAFDTGMLAVDARHSCITSSAAIRTASRW